MDNRAIGVFDSGLGGLTAYRELSALLPYEDIIYFGDTARVPYGTRGREIIIQYARQDVQFLSSFDLKAILIACGTVSTTSLDTLRSEFDLPMFGIVEAASAEAVAASKTGSIGVLGTPATVRTGAFERQIMSLNPDATVLSFACPLFVPLVENGRYRADDPVVQLVVADYLQPLRDAGVDTVVLGCTHYPLLAEAIGIFLGEGVTLVDSGAASARAVQTALGSKGLANRKIQGSHRFFASDNPEDFRRLASVFLGHELTNEISQVSIG